MKLFVTIIFSLLTCTSAVAQFAPQAGVAGSDAISATDKRFVAWATTCDLERGWVDIADKSKGQTTLGNKAAALGKRDGSLVSLGDSGVATVTFPGKLYNGPGPDFAVFENGFTNPANPEEAFLEFAFVEVSSDGINFVRFPASCHIDTPQIPGSGVYANARKVNNLAGKYIAGYGTPFDLEELKGTPGLDVNSVSHVRIVDVIGTVTGNGSLDNEGKVINDPYPTPFPSGGFDLDAVGAIHIPGWWPQSVNDIQEQQVSISPNPASDYVHLSVKNEGVLTIIDAIGRVVYKKNSTAQVVTVDLRNFHKGVYYLTFVNRQGEICTSSFSKY